MTETKIVPKAVRAARLKAFLPFAVGEVSYLIPDLPALNRRDGCCPKTGQLSIAGVGVVMDRR
jgi:hypothetical protein